MKWQICLVTVGDQSRNFISGNEIADLSGPRWGLIVAISFPEMKLQMQFLLKF